jgi:1,4-dihydroxy-2-naphthoyl-CoA hydrolase
VPCVSTPPPAWAPAGAISPLDDKLGIQITDFNPDRLVATMPVEGNQQPFG